MASDVAVAELPSTHPIRLGLALNFFHYEILKNSGRACCHAERGQPERFNLLIKFVGSDHDLLETFKKDIPEMEGHKVAISHASSSNDRSDILATVDDSAQVYERPHKSFVGGQPPVV